MSLSYDCFLIRYNVRILFHIFTLSLIGNIINLSSIIFSAVYQKYISIIAAKKINNFIVLNIFLSSLLLKYIYWILFQA